MGNCLSDHDLAAFVEASATPEQLSIWRGHLDTCDACAVRLARVHVRPSKSGDSEYGKSRGRYEGPDEDATFAIQPPSHPEIDAGGALPPADAIPGYRILKELHRGGQGVVYQAIQLNTKRKVALKVMLEGPFAGSDSKRRFEREIALVGSLRHPNIIPIFDSGVAEGRFYYAMEYIRGEPLSQYVQSHKLPVDDTLRLFKKVCDAVDYAHQKGVIHRDLKPSNILVDERGDPYVLDFGLAKVGGAEAEDASQAAMISVTGQVMGTLPYMSPEQARGRPDQVDMRSDVYALGVILYELLTGQYPYEVTGEMADVLRNIQETEPGRPSIIRRQVGDEIETIVLKALSKAKERRYYAAGPLGEDIGRFLAGEPIEAKRDSALYLFKRTLRRYKVAAAVAAGFLCIVTVAFVLSTTFWRQAALQRDDADAARQLADSRLAETTVARDEAQRARERLRRQLYVYNVTRAGGALDRNNVALMQGMLEACPEDLRGWEWNRLHWLADRSQRTLKGHEGPVQSVAFSPNGQRIASGSGDGTVRIWDATTGEALQVLDGHEGGVNTVAFSPEGSILVSGSHDRTIKLWNIDDGTMIQTLRGHDSQVSSVVFTPDGKRIVSGSLDKTVRVWDVATAREVLKLSRDEEHKGRVWSLAISPDGEFIASGGDNSDGELTLWETGTGRRIWSESAHGHFHIAGWVAGAINGLAFRPGDGGRIVSSGHDKMLKLWNSTTGAHVATMSGHEDTVSSVAFSPDGKRIASASKDSTVRLWDEASGEELATLLGHAGPVFSVAFRADGKQIVSGGEDTTLKLWDADNRPNVLRLRGHIGAMRAVAFSPDGRYLTSGGFDSAKIWDVVTGEEVRNLHGQGGVLAVAYSPDGRYIATGGIDTTMKLWDAHTGLELRTFRGHKAMVNHVAFSSDGKRIASAGNTDGTVRIWDVAGGPALKVFTQEGYAEGVAFSPDGRLIASAAVWGEGSVRLWDTTTGDAVHKFPGFGRGSRWLFFTPDGTRLVVGCKDGTIRFFDAASYENVQTLHGYSGYVRSLALSVDGQRLVAGHQDGTVKVWHAVTGEELLTLRGHDSTVWGVAISPDGKTIASTSDDATVLWESDPPVGGYKRRWDVETARKIVDDRFPTLISSRAVIESLRADTAIDGPVREIALRIAAARGDNPHRLSQESWSVVIAAGKDPAAYGRALRQAEVADQVTSASGLHLSVLGVARYRMAKYDQALQTLRRAEQALQGTLGHSHAANLAFIALSLHQLGQIDEARIALDRLRRFLRNPPRAPRVYGAPAWSKDVASKMFLREAEALIGDGAGSGDGKD